MARGWLDETTLEALAKEVPEIKILEHYILSLIPSFIFRGFQPGSTIPIASVCLHDSKDILCDARYALHESLANRIWYSEKREPPSEISAIVFSRYYADDVAIRLYSASEHLANAIVLMLEIDEVSLKKYKKRNISLQSAVGRYLIKEKHGHPVTDAIIKLAESTEWLKTMDYRNQWVHNQPPAIEGMWLVFKRRDRWQISPDGQYNVLGLGGSDKPDLTIDELLGFIKPALFLFTNALLSVVQFYVSLLEKRGITVNKDKPGIQIRF
jgi:hypothetical protein